MTEGRFPYKLLYSTQLLVVVPRLELSLPQLKLSGTVSLVLLDSREALKW